MRSSRRRERVAQRRLRRAMRECPDERHEAQDRRPRRSAAMSGMTLTIASAIVEHALALAGEKAMKPVAVAVLDAGGHLIAFKRQDQSNILRSDIAIGKAWGVLAAGMGGRDLVKRASAHPYFYNALVTASGGKMIPGIGGVLIRDAQRNVIGAVGVSGDASDKDELCAITGIERAGLEADAGVA